MRCKEDRLYNFRVVDPHLEFVWEIAFRLGNGVAFDFQ